MDVDNLSELPITELLVQWKNGSKTAYDELFIQCYQQFRHQIRKHKLQAGHSDIERTNNVTVCIDSTTNIINHAFLRLPGAINAKLDNRADLNRLIAKVVQSITVDQYRHKTAKKEYSPKIIKTPEFDSNMGEVMCDLERLGKIFSKDYPRAAEILNLSVFAGLNPKKIADIFELSLRTVQADLKFALAWYQNHLHGEIDG